MYAGYLHKRNTPISPPSMQKVYSVLWGTLLFDYDSEEDAKASLSPKLVVEILGVSEWDGKGRANSYPGGFLLVTHTGGTYYVSVASQTERDEWMLYLRKSLECVFANPAVAPFKPSKFIQNRPLAANNTHCPKTNNTVTAYSPLCTSCGRHYYSAEYVSESSVLLQLGSEETEKICTDCKLAQMVILWLKMINYVHTLELHEHIPQVLVEVSKYKASFKIRRRISQRLDMAAQLFESGNITAEEFEELRQVDHAYRREMVYEECSKLQGAIEAFGEDMQTVINVLMDDNITKKGGRNAILKVILRIMELADQAPDLIDFYFPQLYQIHLLQSLKLSTEAFIKLDMIQQMLLVLSQKFPAFGLKLAWNLLASVGDYQEKKISQIQFAASAALLLQLEMVISGVVSSIADVPVCRVLKSIFQPARHQQQELGFELSALFLIRRKLQEAYDEDDHDRKLRNLKVYGPDNAIHRTSINSLAIVEEIKQQTVPIFPGSNRDCSCIELFYSLGVGQARPSRRSLRRKPKPKAKPVKTETEEKEEEGHYHPEEEQEETERDRDEDNENEEGEGDEEEEDNPESLLHCWDGFSEQLDFMYRLNELVESLRFIDRGIRTETLRKHLTKWNRMHLKQQEKQRASILQVDRDSDHPHPSSSSRATTISRASENINHQIMDHPMLGWDPTTIAGEPQYRITRIIVEECRVFRTKARAPSLIICEVMRDDLYCKYFYSHTEQIHAIETALKDQHLSSNSNHTTTSPKASEENHSHNHSNSNSNSSSQKKNERRSPSPGLPSTPPPAIPSSHHNSPPPIPPPPIPPATPPTDLIEPEEPRRKEKSFSSTSDTPSHTTNNNTTNNTTNNPNTMVKTPHRFVPVRDNRPRSDSSIPTDSSNHTAVTQANHNHQLLEEGHHNTRDDVNSVIITSETLAGLHHQIKERLAADSHHSYRNTTNDHDSENDPRAKELMLAAVSCQTEDGEVSPNDGRLSPKQYSSYYGGSSSPTKSTAATTASTAERKGSWQLPKWKSSSFLASNRLSSSTQGILKSSQVTYPNIDTKSKHHADHVHLDHLKTMIHQTTNTNKLGAMKSSSSMNNLSSHSDPQRSTTPTVAIEATESAKSPPHHHNNLSSTGEEKKPVFNNYLVPHQDVVVSSAQRLLDEGAISHEEYLQLMQSDRHYRDENARDEAFIAKHRVEHAFGETFQSKKERILGDKLDFHLLLEEEGEAEGVAGGSEGEDYWPAYDLKAFIVKTNDDLRQEICCVQLMQICKEIFDHFGLSHMLYLKPYRILCTGYNSGVVEVLGDAISLDALKKTPGFTSLLSYFNKTYNTSPERLLLAKYNFMASLAAYSLFSYLLLIKDRHNGNLLLDSEGHILHIDFGFLLSIAPGGSFSVETAPFKLTEEMVELLGGLDSPLFGEFVTAFTKGFIALQANCENILSAIQILSVNSTFPCFQGKPVQQILEKLKSRFRTELNVKDAVKHCLDLITNSYGHYGTRQYDTFQYYTNGILP